MENFDNQGRRKDQYESSAKNMLLGLLGLAGVIVSFIIYGILF